MLNSEQITQLNQKIRQEPDAGNSMVTLIRAAKQAALPFKDVLEYVLTQALQAARAGQGDRPGSELLPELMAAPGAGLAQAAISKENSP